MVYSQENIGSSSGPSSSRPRSETPVAPLPPPPPHSPESTSANTTRERLRTLVTDPNDSVAVSKRVIDILRDVQSSSRAEEQANGIHLTISPDQLNDLLLLSHQNLRNASHSSLAGIESQLSELTSRVSEVHHAIRGSSRHHPPPWSRIDPVPPSYDTPPPTGYGGPAGRDRGPPQPLGYVGPDGRVYGLMEDQRRWPPAASSYSGGNPTWPRGGEYGDHARPPPASAPGELGSWHPIGRRLSRAEDGVGAPSQPLSQPRDRERERDYPHSTSEHGLHVSTNTSSSRPESGSSVISYDRPTNGQMSPVVSSSVPPTQRPGLEKIGRPHMVAPLSSGSAPSTSTALTDPTSKAPSISFLVNPSYDHTARTRADSRSPPPGLPHPLSRYDNRHHPHHGHHPSMELDGHMHVRSHHHNNHGHHPYGHRSVESLDGSMSFSGSMGGGKMAKTSAPSSSRSDVLLGGPGKRRIRNGACTFCREKKLACRPGPMADDPTATGPATCDQCYRRQRTCQHDPEHRRRRRPMPPKKPSGTSEDGGPSRSIGGDPPHYGHHSSGGASGYGPMSASYDYEGDDGDNRMESEDPLLPSAAGAASSPEVSTVSVSFAARERDVDTDRERTLTRPSEPVKDEEVDQLDTEWMQPD